MTTTKFMQFTCRWVRDGNTLKRLQPSSAVRKPGPAVSPGDYAAQLEQMCQDRVDSAMFPDGGPRFRVETEPVDGRTGSQAWEFTVRAVYPAGCEQAQDIARKLKNGGFDSIETTVTVLHAQME